MKYEGASQLCEAPFLMQTMHVSMHLNLCFLYGVGILLRCRLSKTTPV